MNTLLIKNLKVSIADKPILKGFNLEVGKGEVHVIMGPNGSGKSTLAYTLMGHPNYKIDSGEIIFRSENINKTPTYERAKNGLFLALQYPNEIEGVSLRNFLRQSYNAIHGGTDKQIGLKDFRKLVNEKMQLLDIKPEFIERSVNCGFSGGEKKKAEALQLAVLQPKLAILDEIDSGLDIDALRVICKCLNDIKDGELSYIIITHYQRILNYITPDFVHIMQDGKIVKSGDYKLVKILEKTGYQSASE